MQKTQVFFFFKIVKSLPELQPAHLLLPLVAPRLGLPPLGVGAHGAAAPTGAPLLATRVSARGWADEIRTSLRPAMSEASHGPAANRGAGTSGSISADRLHGTGTAGKAAACVRHTCR